MPKAKKLNPRTILAIHGYVKKGYSANRIQKQLQAQHLGIRRKTLLAEIRRVKGQPSKAETVKYIPKKYARARWKARAKRIKFEPIRGKQVTLTGLHKGKLISKTQHGSGKDLFRFVKDEMTGDYWDEKPHIHS
ncbi:hypothetical protein G4O51_08045 [Candidatus Bathyarchaeota archaeon A05DMB-2]|nr:hypothetical protein [Candidatus Bathyarchaeota archaeon A05DMB-2]